MLRNDESRLCNNDIYVHRKVRFLYVGVRRLDEGGIACLVRKQSSCVAYAVGWRCGSLDDWWLMCGSAMAELHAVVRQGMIT